MKFKEYQSVVYINNRFINERIQSPDIETRHYNTRSVIGVWSYVRQRGVKKWRVANLWRTTPSSSDATAYFFDTLFPVLHNVWLKVYYFICFSFLCSLASLLKHVPFRIVEVTVNTRRLKMTNIFPFNQEAKPIGLVAIPPGYQSVGELILSNHRSMNDRMQNETT